MKHANTEANDWQHRIAACRQRLRRYRASRKEVGPSAELAQSANRDSSSFGSEIDRRTPPRARCEGKQEADGT